MVKMDEIFQERLASLESGVPLEQVIAGLPADAASLEPALRMAARVRSHTYPQMTTQAASQQRARMASAARKTTPLAGRTPQPHAAGSCSPGRWA